MKKYCIFVTLGMSGLVGCAVDSAPVDSAPVDSAPVDSAPVEDGPALQSEPSVDAPAPSTVEGTSGEAKSMPAIPAELEEQEPLPAYMTREEHAGAQRGLRPFWSRSTSPPQGEVAIPAEFSALDGVIVRIPMYSPTQDFFGQMLHEIVKSDSTPYILVEDSNEADAVQRYFLEPYGTSNNSVEFIRSDNDAFWSRDFGPFFVYLNGERAIVDMEYYSTRPNDDYVPIVIGDAFDEDVYSAPLSIEGGNFMTDGRGTCWVSTGVLESNDYSRSQVQRIFGDYLGCETVGFITPLPGEGTTHIDMFSKILDVDTILVAYSNESLGASQSQIRQLELAAEQYASTPKPGGGSWNIVRIPMVIDNYNSVFNAYTNSLISNGSVLVPTYDYATDADALRAYRDALPGYRVVGIPASAVIPLGGSVHCTTMQVPVDASGTTQGVCGDGTVDEGEYCDGDQVSCASLGFSSGVATCNATCTGWDTSGCETSSGERRTHRASGVIAADDYVIIGDRWFDAALGSFDVQLTGTGDADLYVWKDVSTPN